MSPTCCEELASRLGAEDEVIRYSAALREYTLPVRDGGTSGIVIRFCPWCGHELPESLREEWFSALEALGVDPWVDEVPREFRSAEWWEESGGPSPAH